jgi:hypothetical protein
VEPAELGASPACPPAVREGAFHAYFVFDVADTIELATVAGTAGTGAARAPLQLRREASTGFIAFPVAPVVVALPSSGELSLRAKFFDYGVISIRLTRPFAGSWSDFAAFTRRLRHDPSLEQIARDALQQMLTANATALDDPHAPLLEDYFVFAVDAFAEPVDAGKLLAQYGPALASLVLSEERRLMAAEQVETLRVNFSYFEDDLAVIQWDTAFLYDRPEGGNAILDILEFANTQLAELRTYDLRLDEELDTIYKLDPKRPTRRFGRKEAQQAADRLRYLIVDVIELTDRAGNALKIIGDAYYARLYRGAAGRLGLKDWQRQIDSKLQSVNEIYQFFTDQAQASRGESLELIVIALIVIEIIVGLLTLRH